MFEPQLHQIRIEGGECVLERAAELSNCHNGCIGHGFARRRLGEPAGEARRQGFLIGDAFGAVRGIERGIDLGEVPDVRAMNDRGASLMASIGFWPPWLASEPPMKTMGVSR